MKIKITDNAGTMLSIFLPLFAIHCMEQLYFVYGNVLSNMKISPELTGWILGSFFIAIMLFRPLGSWLLENFGIRRTLVIGSAVGFVGCSVLFAASFETFAGSVPILLLGRVLSGISFGIYTIGIFSYQAVIIPEHMRGAVFAIVVSGGILPSATITPIGEWLLLNSYLKTYLALGPLLCIACWYFGSRLGTDETVSKEDKPRWGKYSDLAGSKPFILLLLSGLAISLVDASCANMSLLASEKGAVASYFLGSCAVVAVIVRVAGSKIMNRVPRGVLFAPCGMLMAGSLFLISVVPSNMTFLISGSLFGVGIGAAFPFYLAIISDMLPQGLRPKGTAAALLVYDCGWFLTPLFVGYYTGSFGVGGTFMLLSATMFTVLTLLQFFYWIPRFKSFRAENRD